MAYFTGDAGGSVPSDSEDCTGEFCAFAIHEALLIPTHHRLVNRTNHPGDLNRILRSERQRGQISSCAVRLRPTQHLRLASKTAPARVRKQPFFRPLFRIRSHCGSSSSGCCSPLKVRIQWENFRPQNRNGRDRSRAKIHTFFFLGKDRQCTLSVNMSAIRFQDGEKNSRKVMDLAERLIRVAQHH